MSLRTDQFFFHALDANDDIVDAVGRRIFNTARPTSDENADRVPYIVITLDGVKNLSVTKDDIEGDTDETNVSLLVVANDREELATLTESVRAQCRTYLSQVEEGSDAEEQQIAPVDWTFSASEISYDAAKPCFYQTLRYTCDTNRD